ncbi:MAG: iron ABC transporter permease [Candidatus Heimdallarchaeota archaeon]|nr:iron ABC transporter permease [Candidatus Heimdallarchaeota archaeon]
MFANIRRKASSKDAILNRFIIALAIVLLLSFLLAFFYIPIIRIFEYSFSSETENIGLILKEIITDKVNLYALGFTFLQAFASTIICLILGLPAGYFLAKYDFKGKKLLINLLTVPFVLPPIVVLAGFLVTYGNSGWVNTIWQSVTNSTTPLISIFGTIEGVVLAHVFYNISVIIRLTIPAWESVDYDQVEVSRTLGASKYRIFRKIIRPQIMNSVIAASLLVFIYTFNSFAIVLKLANPTYKTIEVLIYRSVQVSHDYTQASFLALLQLILNSIVIILYIFFDRKSRQIAEGKESNLKTDRFQFRNQEWRKIVRNLGVIFFLMLIGLFTFLPILAVIIRSFIPDKAGNSVFYGYQEFFSNKVVSVLNANPLTLLGNTLWIATISTLITLILSLLIVFILRSRYQSIRRYKTSKTESLISYLIILPMATSSITLATGVYLQYRGSAIFDSAVWVFIIVSHVIISVPFATRTILAAYNRIDVELMNVASTLGASRSRVFRKIVFPMIYKGIIVGGLFSFAISLGEFGATYFLARDEFKTLSIGIYDSISSQTLQIPLAMASLLIIITLLCFYAIHKLGEIELKV